MRNRKEKETNEILLIQQHLANERTFLAWVRTAIAVVGLGFLGAGVVFRSGSIGFAGREVATVIGISAVMFGVVIMGIATKDYLRKRRTINSGVFHAPKLVIWVTFAGLGIIDIFLLALVIMMYK